MRSDAVNDKIWSYLPFVLQNDENIFVGIKSTRRRAERKGVLPFSHSDSPCVGRKLEERYLGFRQITNGKDSTWGDVDDECIIHGVKQVDTVGPLKVFPSVNMRPQLFSTPRNRHSAKRAIHHTRPSQFEVVLQQRGTVDHFAHALAYLPMERYDSEERRRTEMTGTRTCMQEGRSRYSTMARMVETSSLGKTWNRLFRS
jgi:hypothetical protein